jgi:hypothetical protein
VCTADDIRAYAKDCYGRLGIQPLTGPFQCKNGNQLVTIVDGKIRDINCPAKPPSNPKNPLDGMTYTNCDKADPTLKGKPNPDAATTFPTKCDYPSWLPNGTQCYGNSYIQTVPNITGLDGKASTTVQGALLCRHKISWSDDDKDFPDIAMILHNTDNGETCWFQTADSACRVCSNDANKACAKDTDCTAPGTCKPATAARCDGTNIIAPDQNAAPGFWLQPTDASKINCVRCHDNGPFMNSRWMNNAIRLEDKNGKYLNNGFGFSTAVPRQQFDFSTPRPTPTTNPTVAWAPTSFVVISKDGLELAEGLRACASACHKIHTNAEVPDPQASFFDSLGLGRNYGTFKLWHDWTTGSAFPPSSNLTDTSKDPGFSVAYWMPPGFATKAGNVANYDKAYKKHLAKLKACMAIQGKGADNKCMGGANDGKPCVSRVDCPGGKCVGECQQYIAQLNNNPNNLLPGAGARIYASLDNGATWPANLSFPVSDPPNESTPYLISPPNNSPIVAWEADPTIQYCSIQATFPPGVVSPNAVSTASNWGLPDQQVSTGPLTIPGLYEFDLNCDGDLAASLIFQVAGTPPTLLKMHTIVNGIPGNTAMAGTNASGPISVQSNARPIDTVFLSWSADNVIDGTCTLTGPGGFSSTDPTGFIPVTVTAGSPLTYSLGCSGPTASYSIQDTINPISGIVCDVNEDGQIDTTDIKLITAAFGVAANPNDLRDADGNGIINANDARVCAVRCTNPLCSPQKASASGAPKKSGAK